MFRSLSGRRLTGIPQSLGRSILLLGFGVLLLVVVICDFLGLGLHWVTLLSGLCPFRALFAFFVFHFGFGFGRLSHHSSAIALVSELDAHGALTTSHASAGA